MQQIFIQIQHFIHRGGRALISPFKLFDFVKILTHRCLSFSFPRRF